MSESNEQKKKLIVGGVLAAVVAVAAGIYFWPKEAPPPAPVTTPAPVTEAPANYPVPETVTDAPLPALEESDAVLRDALAALFGASSLEALLVPNEIVRHFVVTVDNLPRKKVAERLKPIKPIPGKFLVGGPEGAQFIAAENAARYTTAIRMLDAVDTQSLVAMYFRMYPLLQQAYVDLGYPTGYFNNRMVEVIDHLLATPVVEEPIQLVQPNVMYEFADLKLEGLSAGQKTLIRMGNANAAALKKKLREIRAAITAKGPA